ncbi:MAG: division/cell wall cluster transcriptional repressor MraZ [Candidatus Cloacimonetes bacterium]|nr:division/cell wall cluster transcriptional repressor MraZ [Candidatus Cloacimonadota bacterium]
MLIGQFTQKITSGNRVAIPAKFRNELRGFLYVTQGYEGCLVLVDEEGFTKLTAGVADKPFIRGDVRETTRFLLGNAYELEVDEQGRFVLPKNLHEYAEMKEEVIFLGLKNWIEIWDKEKWKAHKKNLEEKGAEIAERLSNIE